MTSSAGMDRTAISIMTERTLSRSQQTKIEVALPAEFRRSPGRRLQSVLMPLLVPVLLVAIIAYNGSAKPDPGFSFDVYSRFMPAMLGMLLLLAVLGFFFLHRVTNWLTNILLDLTGGAYLRIDSEGLTDARVSRKKIAWADVERVDLIRSRRGVEAAELTLKSGAHPEFRRFRLDYRIFGAALRLGNGAKVGIDVRYFDTDAYVIASVIKALASGPRTDPRG